MEERQNDYVCNAELLKAGGGEYSINQARAHAALDKDTGK
jgi:hypothetical protein